MGRRIKFGFDTKGFEDLAARFDGLGGDLQAFFTDQLEQIGETVGEDTLEAVRASNLPAGGKYSQGDTAKSIIQNPKVSWTGNIGSLPIGFDYAKPGAGGFLITGTPRMKPDYQLETIYARKKYCAGLMKEVSDALTEEIGRRMKGG